MAHVERGAPQGRAQHGRMQWGCGKASVETATRAPWSSRAGASRERLPASPRTGPTVAHRLQRRIRTAEKRPRRRQRPQEPATRLCTPGLLGLGVLHRATNQPIPDSSSFARVRSGGCQSRDPVEASELARWERQHVGRPLSNHPRFTHLARTSGPRTRVAGQLAASAPARAGVCRARRGGTPACLPACRLSLSPGPGSSPPHGGPLPLAPPRPPTDTSLAP